jgi:quercetin 2,3-dioxygenase
MLSRTKPVTIMKAASAVLNTMALPSSGPFRTLDPFLFCVYHKDAYPPAHDDTMEAPQRGNGMDFDPSAPYRMYHGEMIPGT